MKLLSLLTLCTAWPEPSLEVPAMTLSEEQKLFELEQESLKDD